MEIQGEIVNYSTFVYHWTYDKLISWGVPVEQANWVNLFVLLGLMLIDRKSVV